MIDDSYSQHKALERGDKARAILENDIWQEAWKVYEERILQDFRTCKSDDVSRLQQLKMLLLAGEAAKKHLEALVAEGKFAAADLTFKQEKQPLLKRIFNT